MQLNNALLGVVVMNELFEVCLVIEPVDINKFLPPFNQVLQIDDKTLLHNAIREHPTVSLKEIVVPSRKGNERPILSKKDCAKISPYNLSYIPIVLSECDLRVV